METSQSPKSPARPSPSSRSAVTPPSHLGMDAAARQHVCTLLAVTLADQHVLYQKTRLCHWNLVGGRFDVLHQAFEGQYEALAAAIDATAERIRMLDGIAPGSLRELQRSARLQEVDGRLVDGGSALQMLLADHEACAIALRTDIGRCEGYGDVGTADFLTGLLRDHEKTAWMLRAHLTVPGVD